MHPLLFFSAGIVAGAAALRLLKNEKTRNCLGNMQNQIRSAAIGGLSAVEQSSARWRNQLAPDNAACPSPETEPTPEQPTSTQPGPRKVRKPAKPPKSDVVA